MIDRVSMRNFKKFSNSQIDLKHEGLTYLAGGNNSGKSTILQAIAVWEFARSILINEKGKEAICTGYQGQGLGLSDDEFSPILIASLKHLWTNLKPQIPGEGGYSLSITCFWSNEGEQKHLGTSLALTNDRLFIKASSTNLTLDDSIPAVAYLPPFAGISSRENKMSGAERRMMVGKGLAGGVIRNILLDMFETNQRKRSKLKEGRAKIKGSDLAVLRRTDPWEKLQKALGDIFAINLIVSPFNDLFHTYIKVNAAKGTQNGYKFVKHPGYQARDLMAEGSGFLQWLSVYVLALSEETDVLLLDEPDAHLHPSLQTQLVESLYDFAETKRKQVLLATHSTEILRGAYFENVMRVRGNGATYLKDPDHKVGLFAGLGSDYAPKLDPLRKHKRMLLVENKSDARMLENWASVLGIEWPSNLVVWPWTGGNKDRRLLFLQLRQEVPDLRCISIRDRDDEPIGQIDRDSLRDKSINAPNDGLELKVWRRRHIENYCFPPRAIAVAAGCDPLAVTGFFGQHALVIPDDYTSRDVASAIIDARGKQLVSVGEDTVKTRFGVSAADIALSMNENEVSDDVRYLIDRIVAMCASNVA